VENQTISVKDNGVGMKESIKNDIFRTDKKPTSLGTEKESGTGIGLLLVKAFVEINSGRVWLESEEEEGATFYFTLLKAK